MQRYLITLILSTILLFQTPVLAWNNYGHMSVAYVAYQNLTPKVRVKVNALLAKNPDFHNWVKELPPGTPAAQTNLMLFMIAATWSDRIKGQSGFQEDNQQDQNKCGPVSTQNIGFTDHFRHRCWHFIDIAFSQDGTTDLPPTPVPNAQERVDLFRTVLGGTDADLKAYDLSWILHLVGDLHQPLHCTTRVSQVQTNGDAGGNLLQVTTGPSSQRFHQFCDGVLGPNDADTKTVAKSAKRLPSPDATKAADVKVGDWVAEGVQLAKDSVYTTPIGTGPSQDLDQEVPNGGPKAGQAAGGIGRGEAGKSVERGVEVER